MSGIKEEASKFKSQYFGRLGFYKRSVKNYDLKSSEFVVACDKYQEGSATSAPTKYFLIYDKEDKFFSDILDNRVNKECKGERPTKSVYEYLFEQRPRRMFLDIDCTEPISDGAKRIFKKYSTSEEEKDNVFTQIHKTVLDIFKNIFGYDGEKYISSTVTRNPKKISMHVLFDKILHNYHHTTCKDIFRLMQIEAKKGLTDYHEFLFECMDQSVYSSKQQVRLIFSCKIGNDYSKIPFIDSKNLTKEMRTLEMELNNFKKWASNKGLTTMKEDYLEEKVTHYPYMLGTNREFSEIPTDLKDKIEQLPKVKNVKASNVEDFEEEIKNFNINEEVMKRVNNWITSNNLEAGDIMKGEKCFIMCCNNSQGYYCPICEKTHEHRNPMIFINERSAYLNCCRKKEGDKCFKIFSLPKEVKFDIYDNYTCEDFEKSIKFKVHEFKNEKEQNSYWSKIFRERNRVCVAIKCSGEGLDTAGVTFCMKCRDENGNICLRYKSEIALNKLSQFLPFHNSFIPAINKKGEPYDKYYCLGGLGPENVKLYTHNLSAYKLYSSVNFVPKNRYENKDLPHNVFNMFEGFEYTYVKNENLTDLVREKLNMHIKHIDEILCSNNKEASEFFHYWLCYTILTGKKTNSCVVITGPQGLGKTYLFEFMEAQYKFLRGSFKTAKADNIYGKFNYDANKVFVCLEEITAFGSERISNWNTMKDKITSKTMTLEIKNIPQKTVSNYANYLVLSNYSCPIYVNPGEQNRRFLVLDPKLTKDEVKATYGKDYYKKLFKCCDLEVSNAYISWMKDKMDAGLKIDMRNPPLTVGLEEIEKNCMSDDDRLLLSHFDISENGEFIEGDKYADPVNLIIKDGHYDMKIGQIKEIFGVKMSCPKLIELLNKRKKGICKKTSIKIGGKVISCLRINKDPLFSLRICE